MYKKLLHDLEKRIEELLIIDKIELENLARRIRKHSQEDKAVKHLFEKLKQKLDSAEKRCLKETADAINFSYPDALPISARVEDIKQSVEENQVIIICGSTGSGKTTQLPKIALDLGQGRLGRIGCTQPRRLAATAMAKRVATELDVECGEQVGFHVRFNKRIGDQTVIKFMTDGILLSETQRDPDLLQYDTIIVDEAHERSLNIDFILGYLKQLKQRRPELKIIISSATLDAENFSDFFDDAPILTIEGRTFPVDDYFLPPNEDEELSQHIARAVDWISDIDNKGDVLVFLPGEREIRDVKDMLEGREVSNTEILPLFGRLSISEQQRVFTPNGQRRIILATNVAETSITIPNIHYVIDSGQVRISRYNPRNHIQGLQVEQVSQASAKQRRGRCGRIAEGICIYLYSEETLTDSPEFTDPEIRRTSLAGVILQMAILGLKKIEHFPFLDPPQSTLIREGYQTLRDINAIDKRGEITPSGRKIASMPLDPHLGRMIIDAHERNILPEIIIITTFLSMQDPRERPLSRQASADQAHLQWRDPESDFIGILNLWNSIMDERSENSGNSAFKHFCRNNFLSFLRVREWINLTQDLARSINEADMPKINILTHKLGEPHYEKIHKSILAGVPSNIGMYDNEEKNYTGTRSRRFYIFPGSTLHSKKPPSRWVMTFSLVSTTRVFARQVAEIESKWLEDVAPHLCKSIYDKIKWDKQAGFVYAREMVSSGGLLINAGNRIHYGSVLLVEAREIFIRDAMVYGRMISQHEWLKKHQKMIRDIKNLEEKVRRPDSMWDADAVYEHFDKIIPEDICSTKGLERWLYRTNTDISMDLDDAMILQLSPVNIDDFPDFISFSGHEFELRYSFDPGEPDDGVSIVSKQDELNLIPSWGMDWLVPGYLQEKIEYMIKALPKDQRRVCNPAIITAEKFIEAVDDDKIFTEQALTDALADFLSDLTDTTIKPDDFEMDKLHESMFMKVAELDEEGYIIDFHRELPDNLSSGSMLSPAVNGIGEYLLSGLQEWPEDDVPENITLPGEEGREVYPALCAEEDSIGRQVFMDQREAEYEHKHGLVKLFYLLYGQQVKFLKKSYKLSHKVQLALCMNDQEQRYEEDFIYSVIISALTENGHCDIRTKEEFEERSQTALEEMTSVAQKHLDALEEMLEKYEQIRSLLDKIGDRAETECSDINQQLEFLFRPGFLTNETIWKNYPRYLRALQIRTERLNSSPSKDNEKMQPLAPFIERFRLALMAVDNFEKAFDLFDFWQSFEELRIASFAPEVQTTEKISPKRLQEKWDDLRL
jgi:ATP-dependent RNA helicase HrpA